MKYMRSIVALPVVCSASLALNAQEVDTSDSEMRPLIERYSADRNLLNRSSATALSADHMEQLGEFYSAWLAKLEELDFDAMSQDGRIDYLLFRNQLDYELLRIPAERDH